MLETVIVWNVVVMLIFGLDKLLAIKKGQRIPEFMLLLLSFLFAPVGALCGMVLFHHKTGKLYFRLIVFASVLANLIFFYIFN